MSLKYILRPRTIYSTPRKLTDAINQIQNSGRPESRNCSLRRYYSSRMCQTNTLFIGYRSLTEQFLQHPDNRGLLYARNFYNHTKADQRKILSDEGLPVVPYATTYEEAEGLSSPSGKFVVRPLVHSGGQEYRITLDCRDFHVGREYIQVLIKKKREFRVLFCLGQRVSLLRKRCSNIHTPEGPWNHAQGSFFVSIRNEENFYPGTEFLVQLSEGSIIKNSDLCGVDIIQDYDNQTWILEVNSAPAISIQNNLNKATEIILNHPRFTD